MSNTIKGKQLYYAYQQSKKTSPFNFIFILIILPAIWGKFPEHLIYSWAITGAVLSVCRYWILNFFDNGIANENNYKILGYVLLTTYIISGLFWASTAFLFITIPDITVQAVIAVTMSGALAGTIPTLAVYYPAFFCFAIPCTFSAAYQLFQLESYYLSTLGVLNFFAGWLLVTTLNKVITNAITLDSKNELLLKEVTQAKDDAEQANIAKSQFLAAASHDLRQPLHSMGLFIYALKNRLANSNDESRDILEQISKSHGALDGLFTSLLEISRLDAGSVKPTISDVSLTTIIPAIVNEFSPIAAEKHLSLTANIEDLTVKTDPILLSRILRNLLTNAVKFTQSGSIHIEVKRSGEHIACLISDTGIGIPEHEHDNIFNEYHQLSNQERDRTKGIGLGLAVVRKMAKLLQHDIALESEINKGSTFSIFMKPGNVIIPNQSVTHKTSYNIGGLTVLIVDDEKSILDAMILLLEDLHCRPLAASSLSNAKTLLEETGETPDVIISDYRLGENATGIDVIRAVQLQLDEDIPAILVSGDTDPELLRDIQQKNFFLLHKPVDADQLKRAIFELVKKKAPSVELV